MIELTASQLLHVRWLVFETVAVADGMPVTDRMVWDLVRAGYPHAAMQHVQDALRHLQPLGLVKLERSNVLPWRAEATPHGLDVYRYRADPPASLIRPPEPRGA